jgi:hypothetical protein
MRGDLASAFEKFVERKWQDALNIAAAEPSLWGIEKEKSSLGRGAPKITGSVNVIRQEATPRPHSPSWDVSFGRKCRARYLIGCDGDHILLQCSKLLGMELGERREVLKKTGSCLFCLKHAAELDCYGRGGFSKPNCTQPGCNENHAASVHELLGEESVAVNLVADGEYESEEDEEWLVGTVGIEDAGEKEEETQEDEFEYCWEVHTPSIYSRPGEGGWCSPEPPELSSEEDEEEIRYLAEIVGLGPQGARAEQGGSPISTGVVSPTEAGNSAPRPAKQQGELPEMPDGEGLPREKNIRRRKLRKKVTKDKDYEWELARQGAWLREMLTDSSGSESEEKYARFAESGRWIAEMTGIGVKINDDLKRGVFRTEEAGFLKSS